MGQEKKSGYRTLLMSVLLSSPGPLVLGLGLTVGHSSTQIADFTRRTAELLALIVAFAIYSANSRYSDMPDTDKAKRERKGNLFTGSIMCISGLSMLLLALLSNSNDKGNVIPALVIAFLGVVTNVFFWRKYTSLFQKESNAILGIQARLYSAKSMVDICVTATLLVVLLSPGSQFSYWLDIVGSILVSLYMLRCGLKTIKEQKSHI